MIMIMTGIKVPFLPRMLLRLMGREFRQKAVKLLSYFSKHSLSNLQAGISVLYIHNRTPSCIPTTNIDPLAKALPFPHCAKKNKKKKKKKKKKDNEDYSSFFQKCSGLWLVSKSICTYALSTCGKLSNFICNASATSCVSRSVLASSITISTSTIILGPE